jgi:hypothetical protein
MLFLKVTIYWLFLYDLINSDSKDTLKIKNFDPLNDKIFNSTLTDWKIYPFLPLIPKGN